MNDKEPGLESAADRYAQAKKRFQRELASEADVSQLMKLADRYYVEVDEISQAVLLRVLDIQPQNLLALARLGQLAWLNGNNIEAHACLRRAEQVAPEDLEVMRLRASLATNWDEKADMYRRILELYPHAQDAEQNLARIQRMSDEEKRRSVLSWPPGQHPPRD